MQASQRQPYPAINGELEETSAGKAALEIKITTQDLHRAAWASSLGSALEY